MRTVWDTWLVPRTLHTSPWIYHRRAGRGFEGSWRLPAGQKLARVASAAPLGEQGGKTELKGCPNDQEKKNSSCHSSANQRGVERKLRSLMSRTAKQKRNGFYVLNTQPIPILREKPSRYQNQSWNQSCLWCIRLLQAAMCSKLP